MRKQNIKKNKNIYLQNKKKIKKKKQRKINKK
jgi:hypothetical protein